MNPKEHILIVGATSGLGAALASHYADRVEAVGVTGRRVAALQAFCAAHPNAVYAVTDVTCPEKTTASLAQLSEVAGGFSTIILCAGVGKMNATLDFLEEEPAILTNVYGWTAVADWAFSYLSRRGGGHLVAISSVAGLRGLAPAPAYAASKAYQIHYLEALRQRAFAAGLPLYVTDIRPGFVRTALLGDNPRFPAIVSVEAVLPSMVRAINRRVAVATVPARWRFVAWLMKRLPRCVLLAFFRLYQRTSGH